MKVSLSRVYQFSAAHRLNSDLLDEQKNVEIYDKCNNINGHGHDYTMEVTVCGKPHPQSGMIISLPRMDQAVKEVITRLDHKHLDKQVDFFRDKISTAEIIIQYLWQELNITIPDNLLYHIRLWETNNNYFEFGKENIS